MPHFERLRVHYQQTCTFKFRDDVLVKITTQTPEAILSFRYLGAQNWIARSQPETCMNPFLAGTSSTRRAPSPLIRTRIFSITLLINRKRETPNQISLKHHASNVPLPLHLHRRLTQIPLYLQHLSTLTLSQIRHLQVPP
jgi:hypothetical protein